MEKYLNYIFVHSNFTKKIYKNDFSKNFETNFEKNNLKNFETNFEKNNFSFEKKRGLRSKSQVLKKNDLKDLFDLKNEISEKFFFKEK